MGMRDFFERMTEGAETAYRRMRVEVLEGLIDIQETLDQVESRVIDLPEGRPAEDTALAHECAGAFERLKEVIRSLYGMSSIRQGGMERRTRIGHGSIEVSSTMSDEVTEPQRHRALVLLLDAQAEHRPLSKTWSIVRPPYDQQLGSVAARVIESLAHDGLLQYQAPFNFVLTDAGRVAAEDALVEKVADSLEKSA